ncbi:MAG: glycosyltransferase [Candidatus Hodarchaeota archaeon]
MKNRVMFVVDSKLTFSEAPPSRFIYIAKSLKEKNFEVEVLGRKGEKIKGLKTSQLSGTKHISRIKILLYTYAKTLSRSYIIIVRGSFLTFFLLPLRIFGKKVILDFHGWLFREIEFFYKKTLYNKLKVAFYYFVARMAVKYSNAIICVSKGTRELLEPKERAKSIVLENGLDATESKRASIEAEKEKEKIYSKYQIPKKKTLVGFLGNWERQLDMETMFKGAKLAEVNMVVIGEGPRLNEFKKTWRNVRFTGKLPRFEALKIIHLCDGTMVPYKEIYMSTSYWSQRKVKDYLSLGKPIIMAEVREREAYLVPNKNVLLYKPGNAKDLADKIKKLTSDKKLQESMKKNNIRLSHRFDWKTLVEESGVIQLIK